METPVKKEQTLQQKQQEFEKACWELRRAQGKLARLEKRKEALDLRVEEQKRRVASLSLHRTLCSASVRVADWDPMRRAAWEQRTGLKLPH